MTQMSRHKPKLRDHVEGRENHVVQIGDADVFHAVVTAEMLLISLSSLLSLLSVIAVDVNISITLAVVADTAAVAVAVALAVNVAVMVKWPCGGVVRRRRETEGRTKQPI